MSRLPTDERMYCLLRFALQPRELLLHFPFQVPVRSLRSNIKQVLRSMSDTLATYSCRGTNQILRSSLLVFLNNGLGHAFHLLLYSVLHVLVILTSVLFQCAALRIKRSVFDD